MSASLVGSEMCIRDSGSARVKASASAHLVVPSCAKVGPAARGHDRAAGPVSYTHLTLPTICSV
eukprot:12730011-Alexandrium_andersonii.AAC.1